MFIDPILKPIKISYIGMEIEENENVMRLRVLSNNLFVFGFVREIYICESPAENTS